MTERYIKTVKNKITLRRSISVVSFIMDHEIKKQPMKMTQKRNFDFYHNEKTYRNFQYSQSKFLKNKVFASRLSKVSKVVYNQPRKRSKSEEDPYQQDKFNIIQQSFKSYKKVMKNKSCCCEECGKPSKKQIKIDGAYLKMSSKMSIKQKYLKTLFQTKVQVIIGSNRLKRLNQPKPIIKAKQKQKRRQISTLFNPNNLIAQQIESIPSSRDIPTSQRRISFISQIKIQLDKDTTSQIKSKLNNDSHHFIDDGDGIEEFQFLNLPFHQDLKFSRVYKSFKKSNNVIDNYLLGKLITNPKTQPFTAISRTIRAKSQIEFQSTFRYGFKTKPFSEIPKNFQISPLRQIKIYKNAQILQLLKN